MRHFYLGCIFLLSVITATAQQEPTVDFKQLNALLTVIPQERKVEGEVEFLFEILKDTDSVFIDARNMDIQNVLLNDKKVEFHNDGNRLWVLSDFRSSRDNQLQFTYTATPKQAIYFIGWNHASSSYKPQVWTQGQGRYTSHWLPS